MQNPVCWFEIYVEDIDRAQTFYESVLAIKLDTMESPAAENVTMRNFPPMSPEAFGAPGALAKMDGMSPGGNGTLVYFSCPDCAATAKVAVENGGKILRDKFSIGQYGFIALIADTEGNTVGLHSMT